MGQYRAGTVSVELGDNVVTGVGTEFLANISAGEIFSILGSGVPYFVGSVLDDEQLVLTQVYAGADAAGQAYFVQSGYTPVLGIPYLEPGDLDTHTIFKRAMLVLEVAIAGAGAPVTFADGALGSPGMRPAGEVTSGLWRPGVGQLGVQILGTNIALFSATGINDTAIGVTTPDEVHATTLSSSGVASLESLVVTSTATVGGSAVATLTAVQTLTNKTLTAPMMTTPTLGVASATTINKVTITAPATGATLTLAEGSTLATVGAFSTTLTVTGATTLTLPTAGTLLTTTGAGSGLTAVDAITLLTKTWASPAAIGTGTPAAGTFTSLTATGNLVVDGDLTVSGTTTTFNTDNISVEDPLMKLARTNTGDVLDVGFYGLYQPAATTLYTGFFRDATDGKYKLFAGLEAEPTTTVNIAGAGYAVATLVANIEGNVTGALTGNASTATALATARAINGTNFDGTSAITVTAAAATLTGTTLAAAVVTSSLTSVGTLNAGSITSGFGAIDIGADTFASGNATITGTIGVSGQVTSTLADGTAPLAVISKTKVANLYASRSDSTEERLVSYLHPHVQTTRRDLVKAGFLPAFFNQQWGGAPMPFEIVDGATGVMHKFDAMTSYVEDDSGQAFINGASLTHAYEGFKASQTGTIAAIWVKLYKVGNPANNLQAFIYSDTGGVPNALVTSGTATAQSGKLHTSKTDGEWYRFVFVTPPSETAGTQYHVVMKSSGAVDASNYWVYKRSSVKKYPHGNAGYGDATPAWTAQATTAMNFIIEPVAAGNVLQSGGIFGDGKLVFYEGSPLNQSGGYCRNLRDIAGFDPTDFTLLLRGTAFTKNKTIWEMQYGMDHDRIVLRCNVTTGFAKVDLYETDGTKHTVTATSVDLSSGDHNIAIRVRAKGDGADILQLYVNGVSNGTALTSQTITFDTAFGTLGTEWLGGGFAVAPTWTQKLAMGVLPSADSPVWTYSGTATESAAFSVSGGKLYQNKNGYTSLQTGYYERAALSLSNANGYQVAMRIRGSSCPSTKSNSAARLLIYDGTKTNFLSWSEYFAETQSNALNASPQFDLKNAMSVLHTSGKGSDFYWFKDGRLTVDGTAVMTNTSGANQISFGDSDAAAGENADVVYDYLAYYNTNNNPPQFTSGSLSEYGLWNGDATSLLAALYNGGTQISIKTYCGVRENWLGAEVVQRLVQRGITNGPTTTAPAASPGQLEEMECFVVGDSLGVNAVATIQNSGTNDNYVCPFIDGVPFITRTSFTSTNFYALSLPIRAEKKVGFGLHKVGLGKAAGAGTFTASAIDRSMTVEART